MLIISETKSDILLHLFTTVFGVIFFIEIKLNVLNELNYPRHKQCRPIHEGIHTRIPQLLGSNKSHHSCRVPVVHMGHPLIGKIGKSAR